MTALDRVLLHASTAAAGVTGLAYFGFKHLMTSGDPFSAVNHPLQPWALRLHVLAAPVVVLAVGLILKDHVVAKYRNGAPAASRRTGIVLLVALGPATLTGYLLPIVASGSARDAIAWAHLGFGIAWLALHAGHVLVSPERRPARDGASAKGVVSSGLRIGRRGGGW
jgi:hypothetical protein